VRLSTGERPRERDADPLGIPAIASRFGFVGIGWNGVQHTLMAELAGPRSAGTAVGLGLALSSLGVTLGRRSSAPSSSGRAVTARRGSASRS